MNRMWNALNAFGCALGGASTVLAFQDGKLHLVAMWGAFTILQVFAVVVVTGRG